MHTNDSKVPHGSRVDRHEHIGKGKIGLEAFRRILNHRAARGAGVYSGDADRLSRATINEMWLRCGD